MCSFQHQIPQTPFPNWLPRPGPALAGRAGHLVTPTVRSPSLPSIHPSSPRKTANIRGKLASIAAHRSRAWVSDGFVRAGQSALPSSLEEDDRPGHGCIERLYPVVQRDADFFGAPRLKLGSDPLRLATDDQSRRTRPVNRIVG